jgi:5-(carboxyamino)imidazole ribonucleotide synthase
MFWGNSQPHWNELLCQPNINLHLYGKLEARAGRKMGHFNVHSESIEQATSIAEATFKALQA